MNYQLYYDRIVFFFNNSTDYFVFIYLPEMNWQHPEIGQVKLFIVSVFREAVEQDPHNASAIWMYFGFSVRMNGVCVEDEEGF